MRWFPDRLMVLLQDVVIVIYELTTSVSLLRNVCISLYVIVPSVETKSENHNKIDPMDLQMHYAPIKSNKHQGLVLTAHSH